LRAGWKNDHSTQEEENIMTRRKRTLYLVLPILALALAALACSGGTSTTHKITGNNGETRIRMKEASGSNTTSVEINEDWSRTSVNATVTLFVETGSCTAVVSGEDGTAITLSASAGTPNQVSGVLVTDGFGDVTLTTDSQGVTNLDLLVEFYR
jgi:hypothetical protein